MYVGAFPYDSYLSTQLLPIDVKRAHAILEHHLCEFVVPVEPVSRYRGNAKPHFAVCFVQHLTLARRSSRPCRAFVCPLVSLVHNRSGMFNSLFHHVSRRTNSGTREDLAHIHFRIAREIGDVMQLISASFSGPSCPVFAWTRRCSSMFVTPGLSNPLLASSLCPHLLRCSHKIPGHLFREKGPSGNVLDQLPTKSSSITRTISHRLGSV